MNNFSYESLSIKYNNDTLYILDQCLLPHEESWILVESPNQMIELIKKLSVRGAPLIGVAAALSLALYSKNHNEADVLKASSNLASARPTAVNLMWAMDEIVRDKRLDFESMRSKAISILLSDAKMCEQMGEFGASLVQDGDGILTHCNAGALATSGIGTAIGVIRKAFEQGKKIHVYVDETRPLLQGARLTAYEMEKLKIPYTLICDNMAAVLMEKKKIQKIFVGSDRIAMNGDFANKIGTYSLAINASYHGVKFYPVAPISTLDPKCMSGEDIEIEQRNPLEVRGYNQVWSPKNANVFNPAFDVTPVKLMTGLVLDSGIYSQKDIADGKLKNLFN